MASQCPRPKPLRCDGAGCSNRWSRGRPLNYYEHHLGDYAEATAHLSFIEDAAYSRCIRKYYTSEKPLPHDLTAVQRLVGARTKEEKLAVQVVLEEFFVSTDEGWRHHRCDEEIARYRDKQSKAKRSADARWLPKPQHTERNAIGMRTHSDRNANALPTQSEGNALQSPVSSLQSPIQEKNARARSEASNPKEPERLLERLRENYPKGIYRESDWIIAEREARKRIDEGHCAEELIEGCRRYAKQCEAKGSIGTQYVESPKKFFALPECKFRDPFPLPINGGRAHPEDTGWRPTE